ncbi:GNAT family N-acetyltransferase [Pontibacter sp. MBLB2868]|uniref:GNAT family N-acetyltransferase n=1 Tax=Pontibacter sp. MBLB2868 TaxID=3451555 RepID=UPI003F754D31
MKIVIRNMAKADTDSVLGMMRDLAVHHDQLEYVKIDREQFVAQAFREHPSFGVFVAEAAGELVGYVSYTLNFSIWAGSTFLGIDDVFVKPGYRSLGVGQQLMTYTRKEAERLGLSHLKWEVEKDNHRAIRFYEDLGASLRIKGVVTWRNESEKGQLAAGAPEIM